MADFRRFLASREPVVLPYFGGTRVDAADRRFRLEGELAPGWWQFRIEGRRAVPIEAAAPVDLAALPRLRGHWACGWLVLDGRRLARVALPPDDEPPPLARASARRWYSGDLLFDGLDFEDDAELGARAALEARQPIGELRGVVPSLRTAFGVALGHATARELGVPVSVPELVPRAVGIADRGREAVAAWLPEIVADRRRADEDARRRAESIRLESAAGTARAVARHGDPVQRADEALDGAKARLLSCRRLERGARLDVAYEVDGTRVMSIVDAETLQVIDPGVCLGHGNEYRVLTLDAMPSVVREAIETDALNITRWE
ncbi:MAG TPA: hypothetical protein VLM79_06335 [Kofleriaceae bacterium]|nr:hypothetical protein [Kofleriaceae bacterium]